MTLIDLLSEPRDKVLVFDGQQMNELLAAIAGKHPNAPRGTPARIRLLPSKNGKYPEVAPPAELCGYAVGRTWAYEYD